MRKRKLLVGLDDWVMKDTGLIRMPRGEKFVSFIKFKRKLIVLSNKAIYQLKLKKEL